MHAVDPVGRWRREDSASFRFGSRRFDPSSGLITLGYRLDDVALEESFRLPVDSLDLSPKLERAVESALELLHWIAGISYWKAACPGRLQFEGAGPDRWQSRWLTRLYREGLAEFAWHNRLDPAAWPEFPEEREPAGPARAAGLIRHALVPMGGGKDSLVALERLLEAGHRLSTVQVGTAERIRKVAERTGQDHLVIERRLDPLLGQLNRAGAWNGHVPITAINAAVMVVLALVTGSARIVFANERSADEATLVDEQSRPVNHQFSKSLVFERMFSQWVRHYVAPDLEVFSILRRDRELAVCREFAGLERYHDVFSSCNRNFHLDGARTRRWCGECPKCRFVFLALAPFMPPDRLVAVFGRDLLADSGQIEGFRALLALDGVKPFECVGEAMEARAAIKHLAGDSVWRGHAVVTALAGEIEAAPVPDIEALCRPDGEHLIPDDLLAHA